MKKRRNKGPRVLAMVGFGTVEMARMKEARIEVDYHGASVRNL
jgi:hypothetical protein